jgi:hypothetical protein
MQFGPQLAPRMTKSIGRCFATLLVLATGLCAHAQNYGSGTVAGQVLCSDTSKPARFAQVSLSPDISSGGAGAFQGRRSFGANTSTTGPDGTFTIKNVPAGVYDLQVTVPGYIQPMRQLNLLADADPALRQPWLEMLTKVTVQAGQTTSTVATAYRGADLLGTVLYDDGSPAAGITVSTLFSMSPSGASASAASSTSATANLVPAGVSAQTDDRGRFYLSGLADGTYTVQASPRGGLLFPVYLGNTVDRAQAELLTVKSGEERTDLAMQIDITNLHHVRGVLASSDSHALAGVSVALSVASGSGPSLRCDTASDGSFSFSNVPDGKFTVAASPASDPDSHAIYKSASTQITVSGTDIIDVVLTPSP